MREFSFRLRTGVLNKYIIETYTNLYKSGVLV